MFLLLVVLFGFSFYFYAKSFKGLFVGLLALLMVAAVALKQKYETLNTKQMIVYAGQKSTHINFLLGINNYVYTTDSVELEKVAGGYWKKHQLNRPVYLGSNGWLNDGFAYFGDKRILILQEDLLGKQNFHNTVSVDYLIVGNGLKPKFNQLLEIIHPATVIVDKSISDWYTDHIRHVCEERGIGFYAVAEKGAYVLNFAD